MRSDPEDEGCGGFCSCFGSRKKPRQPPRSHAYEQKEGHFGNEMKTNYYPPSQSQPNVVKKPKDRKPFLYT